MVFRARCGMKDGSGVGGGAVRRGRRRGPDRGDVLQRRQGIHEVDQGESQVIHSMDSTLDNIHVHG